MKEKLLKVVLKIDGNRQHRLMEVGDILTLNYLSASTLRFIYSSENMLEVTDEQA